MLHTYLFTQTLNNKVSLSALESEIRADAGLKKALDYITIKTAPQKKKFILKVEKFIVFNIGGNKYRLIAHVQYNMGKLYIRNILQHKEYDKNKWKNDKRI